jgi:hypothetical protein
MEKPRETGLFCSRPVSRILSRGDHPSVQLPGSSAGYVGGASLPCTGRGLASRPCRHGRWWALTPPFHPYRRRLRRSRHRRSVFCATFRRLSPPPFRERPALWCPDFPRAPEGPRSPGLRTEFYRPFRGTGPPVELKPAFGTADGGAVMEHELAAHRALERRTAEQREQLLLERPVQRRHAHSARNTPETVPRICTWSA